MGSVKKGPEVIERAEVGVDAGVVGHVVAVVAQGRRVHRLHPDAVDAERLDVVELRDRPAEVAVAVAVAVAVGADVQFEEDGFLIPGFRIGHS